MPLYSLLRNKYQSMDTCSQSPLICLTTNLLVMNLGWRDQQTTRIRDNITYSYLVSNLSQLMVKSDVCFPLACPSTMKNHWDMLNAISICINHQKIG